MVGLELHHFHHSQVCGIGIANYLNPGFNRNGDSCWYTRLCNSFD